MGLRRPRTRPVKRGILYAGSSSTRFAVAAAAAVASRGACTIFRLGRNAYISTEMDARIADENIAAEHIA